MATRRAWRRWHWSWEEISFLVDAGVRGEAAWPGNQVQWRQSTFGRVWRLVADRENLGERGALGRTETAAGPQGEEPLVSG